MLASPAMGRGQDGFTLLELLLAITILGLIMSVLAGGLQFGARVWESGEARAEEVTELGVLQDFLRRLLSEAYPATAGGPTAGQRVAFAGAPDGLAFVGLAPARLATGGFHLLSLQLGEENGARSLILSSQPFHAGQDSLALDDAARRTVLLEGIDTVSFAYLGSDATEPRDWQAHWQDEARLPALVRLRVTFADDRQPWPDLVVRPMIDREAGAPGAS